MEYEVNVAVFAGSGNDAPEALDAWDQAAAISKRGRTTRLISSRVGKVLRS
jgi:hypothetical protein